LIIPTAVCSGHLARRSLMSHFLYYPPAT